jgi:microcystin-dependent protein
MGTPYLGEIKIVSFNFAPQPGWAECNGQLLPINQNQALFALLGTTYGGDGRTTFGLPNLEGRVPIHIGMGHIIGEVAGEPTHTLAMTEMPAHTHTLTGNGNNGAAPVPGGNYLARTNDQVYISPQSLVPLAAGTVGNAGNSQAHENMQPYLTLNFVIALQGIFPSRS